MKGFLKRHPELSFRKPEGVKKAAVHVTQKAVKEFMDDIISYLEEQDLKEFLKDRPQNWINMDETNIEFNVMPDKVLTSKDIHHTYHVEPSNHNERITATVTISADGYMYTPQVILKNGFSKIEDVSYAAGGTKISFLKKFLF